MKNLMTGHITRLINKISKTFLMRIFCYIIFTLLFVVSCNSNDKSLIELFPKDLDTVKHIFKYLLIFYLIIFIIHLGNGFKMSGITIFILFWIVYFTHNYGFLKLIFVTLIPYLVLILLGFLKQYLSNKN